MSQNQDDALIKAKELYMQYKTRKEIAEKTGLTESKIKYYASNAWFQEREIIRQDQIRSLQKGNNLSLNRIGTYGLQILENTMKEWKEQGKVLNFNEAVSVAKIVSEMQKIATSNENSTTYNDKNQENSDFSEPKIIEILSSDPFFSHENSMGYTLTTTDGDSGLKEKKEA